MMKNGKYSIINNMKNQKILNWLNKGLIKEALVGKEEFFIPEVTYYNEHDYFLVLNQLEEWTDASQADRITQAVYDAIDELTLDDNLQQVMQFTWCLLLQIKEHEQFRKIFNSDPEFLAKKLYDYFIQKSVIFAQDESKRNFLLTICSELNELRVKLGIGEIEIIKDTSGLNIKEIKVR